MKYSIRAGLFTALLASASCVATPQDKTLEELCGSSTHKLVEINLDTILEEDGYQFFFDRKTGVKYGEVIKTKSPFIATRENNFLTKDIVFTKLDGLTTTKFDDRDLLIQEATLYRFTNHSATMMCLVSLFAGLGQSGSYQSHRWAVSFPINAKLISELNGRFGN